ncbi:gem-associated protein 6 [Harpegnathos saltator]|uniref:Gem-associated protein 6 n=1 Tax=Harpegnathos saltator TaxID=610380 RepID=E2BWP2_HARSA|nr:gem-associated protein 6 [Harpegnathos saltator]EFN79897.1 Gem-associated protein 6 [Harpegnathos saltator]
MTAENEDSDFSHNIYKNDPILFNSYVGKEVKITMKDEDVHCGIVYTIDPVSESVVLLQPKEPTTYSLKIVSGHSVKNIEIISAEERIVPELFLPSCTNFSQAAITNRKNTIKQLFLENRFSVKEEGDILKIEDTVTVEPPYYPQNCKCTNSIILSRIQNILMSK